MIVVSAQVYDPTNDGDYDSEPRIELLVTGIDIGEPDHTNRRPNDTDYIVYEYGEHLVNFVDTLGNAFRREGFDSTEESRDVFERLLSDFNTSGATEHSYFPVTVSADGNFWRELYAPVAWLDLLMTEHQSFRRQGIAGGRWHIELVREKALEGALVWRLAWSQSVVPLMATPRPPYVIDAG